MWLWCLSSWECRSQNFLVWNGKLPPKNLCAHIFKVKFLNKGIATINLENWPSGRNLRVYWEFCCLFIMIQPTSAAVAETTKVVPANTFVTNASFALLDADLLCFFSPRNSPNSLRHFLRAIADSLSASRRILSSFEAHCSRNDPPDPTSTVLDFKMSLQVWITPDTNGSSMANILVRSTATCSARVFDICNLLQALCSSLHASNHLLSASTTTTRSLWRTGGTSNPWSIISLLSRVSRLFMVEQINVLEQHLARISFVIYDIKWL